MLRDLTDLGYKLQLIVDKKISSGLFLIGNFEFGDADGEKESMVMVEISDIKPIDEYLKYLSAMSWNENIDYRRKPNLYREVDFYTVVGEEYRENYLWDSVCDWWLTDPFSQYPARLGSYQFEYHANGQRWKVITK